MRNKVKQMVGGISQCVKQAQHPNSRQKPTLKLATKPCARREYKRNMLNHYKTTLITQKYESYLKQMTRLMANR